MTASVSRDGARLRTDVLLAGMPTLLERVRQRVSGKVTARAVVSLAAKYRKEHPGIGQDELLVLIVSAMQAAVSTPSDRSVVLPNPSRLTRQRRFGPVGAGEEDDDDDDDNVDTGIGRYEDTGVAGGRTTVDTVRPPSPLGDEALAKFLFETLNAEQTRADTSAASPASPPPPDTGQPELPPPADRVRAVFPDADPDYVARTLRKFDNNVEHVVSYMMDGYERVDRAAMLKAAGGGGDRDRDFAEDKYRPAEDEVRKWQRRFLCNEFRFTTALRVEEVLASSGYCLTDAWDALERDESDGTSTIPTRKTRRPLMALDDGDAFATVIAEVSQYTQRREEREAHRRAVEAAHAAGEVFDCMVCFDTFAGPDGVSCSKRHEDGTVEPEHAICVTCYRNHMRVKLHEEGVPARACVDPDCRNKYLESALRRLPLRDQHVFAKLEARLAAQAALDESDTRHTCKCGVTVLVPRGNRVHDCTACGASTCVLCDEPNHVPLSCEEVEKANETLARRRIEERMTEALVRKCACGKVFLKADGCNKMTCTCGRKQCYLCRQPVDSYSHFCGCSDSNCGKCHLWAKPEALDKERVTRVGREELDKVVKENPDLRINVDVGFSGGGGVSKSVV